MASTDQPAPKAEDPPFIPYGRQDIAQADIDAVVEVLKSDFLTQGPAIPRFEEAVCAATGAKHAVAMNSATSALHVGCLALDLGPGDWLWTVPNTFVASANCGLYCGAQIDFVDIDPIDWNMSVAALEAKLVDAENKGRLPKVVVPVAFAGRSCHLREIKALAGRYGFKILEDASHGIGASYEGRPVGCGDFADVTVFSFHPVKIVTSAEGGVAVTNDDAIGARMARLRSHGITRDDALMSGESQGPWYYEQIELGLNYRQTDVQAALGASQMHRLKEYVDQRHVLSNRYDQLLELVPVTGPAPDAAGSRSSLHLYPVLMGTDERRPVFEALRADKIGVNVHYIPVHLQPFYRALGFKDGDFPAAEAYYAGAISLPLHPQLTLEGQDRVVASLKGALAQTS